MKYALYFVLIAISAQASVAEAEEEPFADVTVENLSAIREKLGCQKIADTTAKLGCTILKEFSDAGKPDPQLLKKSNRLSGRRWVGLTVVSGEVNVDGREFPRKSPYTNLIVLGARYSSNFHQKISFENGYAPMYIWPMRAEEVTHIQNASNALLQNEIDEDNLAIQFARSVEMKFSPVRESTGQSLLIGNRSTFLRQRDKTLYVFEIGTSKSGNAKFWLSRIDLNHELSR